MSRDDKSEQTEEKEAVFTTIVGGRPSGSGTQVGTIPRGIEVLVKKASVDPDFRQLLLLKRGQAACEIDLELTEAESNMLSNISVRQLEKIIDNTKVRPEHRAIFMGKVGKLMLAVLAGAALISILTPTLGHTLTPEQLDHIRQIQMQHMSDVKDVNEPNKTDLDIPDN
jgi:hypothetical protein